MYQCPSCRATFEKHSSRCPKCGVYFVDTKSVSRPLPSLDEECARQKRRHILKEYGSKILYAILILGAWVFFFWYGSRENKALRTAAESGDVAEITRLAANSKLVDVRKMGQIVAIAARSAKPAAVKELLRIGADANSKDESGWTALMWAAKNGDLETTHVLLEHGADRSITNAEGHIALDIARQNGNANVIGLLERR